MTRYSPPPARELTALLPAVLDSFEARGCNVRQRVRRVPPRMGRIQLVRVCIQDRPHLADSRLFPAHGINGCCLQANLLACAVVDYLLDGCPQQERVELCLPVQGVFRVPIGEAAEFVPLLYVSDARFVCAGDQLELLFDFSATVYALCWTPVSLACAPAPPRDACQACVPPLYPAYRCPPH